MLIVFGTTTTPPINKLLNLHFKAHLSHFLFKMAQLIILTIKVP